MAAAVAANVISAIKLAILLESAPIQEIPPLVAEEVAVCINMLTITVYEILNFLIL